MPDSDEVEVLLYPGCVELDVLVVSDCDAVDTLPDSD